MEPNEWIALQLVRTVAVQLGKWSQLEKSFFTKSENGITWVEK